MERSVAGSDPSHPAQEPEEQSRPESRLPVLLIEAGCTAVAGAYVATGAVTAALVAAGVTVLIAAVALLRRR